MGEFTTPKPHSLMETERRRAILGFVRRSRSYRGNFSGLAPSIFTVSDSGSTTRPFVGSPEAAISLSATTSKRTALAPDALSLGEASSTTHVSLTALLVLAVLLVLLEETANPTGAKARILVGSGRRGSRHPGKPNTRLLGTPQSRAPAENYL
jgi:hypothetical protein